MSKSNEWHFKWANRFIASLGVVIIVLAILAGVFGW